MKKISIIALALSLLAVTIKTEMRWNPATKAIYSYPAAQNIDPVEYVNLFQKCCEINSTIIDLHRKVNSTASSSDIVNQCIYYLKELKTPTALRLAEDIKKNRFCYPDGSLIGTIF